MGKTDLTNMWHRIKDKKNVVGYSSGLKKKLVNGKERRTWSMRVYVSKKEPLVSLSADDIIPEEMEGIKTDVIEIGELKALGVEDPKKHYRPAPAGVSAIAAGKTACTLGWFAIDNTDEKLVIICNNHCGAGENKLPIGHEYVQPSPYDGEPKVLGYLKRFVEIKYNEFTCIYRNTLHRMYRAVARPMGALNRVDLALIDVEECDVIITLLNIGLVKGKRRATIGESMEKMGRTTGHTTDGILVADDFIGNIKYGRGMAQFGPCGLIEKRVPDEPFSQGGDSSSAIICSSDKYFAGLLFAGSNTHTIYCHYDFIEEDGNVRITW